MIHELSVAYDELHKLEFHLIEEQESQDAILLTMKANTDGGQGGMSSNATPVAIDLTLASVFNTTVGNSEETATLKHHDEGSAAASKAQDMNYWFSYEHF